MTAPHSGVRAIATSPGPPGLARAGEGWVVTCDLTFDVADPAEIAFQIAAARGGRAPAERFEARNESGSRPAVATIAAAHGGLIHLLRTPAGALSVSYRAELTRREPAPAPRIVPDPLAGPAESAGPADRAGAAESAGAADLPDLDRLVYLRPSRYCPSDHIVGFAVAEFGGLPPGRPRADAIASWVHDRVGYVTGSSAVHDSAEHTLLTGQGVCRDFAHLGITLCRALQIPARFAGVYAPGLTPMDFHAVFEAWVDGDWWVYDATRKVPRPSMVRIATGRDAADAAFASVLRGLATLRSIEVTATVTGTLPVDDHVGATRLG
jgi:transglutaminase-like putative cysteine protease